MTYRPTLATAAACVAVGTLAASLCACAPGHRTTSARTAAPTATGAAAPSSPAPQASGPALRAALPTSADLAPGITVSGAYDTGTDFTTRPDLPAPALPDADCTAAPAIDADALTSDYRAAYATENLDNAGNSLQLVAAATNPGDATRQLAEVRDFAARCTTFAAPDPTRASTGGTTTLDTLPALGDQAIRIRVTTTGPGAANDARLEVILVRVGDEIAAVSDADPAHDQAAAVSAATFLATRLTGRPR